ncbi:hypothetical protein C5Y96_16115 [Blastopirellula marina]|uniref:Uncharacterized protein n=1 Tax=Blastopirellula marina TaxID=124 RepID=A0A2S8F8D2_9BACT|nr:hypothetical protein C5Y96_16115 [Blastopirellula marina]RCS49117.1 hypothetical protein DTL36_16135 [Bremerella cremea]
MGRLVLTNSGSGDLRFTYTPDWQLFEEVIASRERSPSRYEYIWGIRGQDDLICREKYDAESNLLERLYSRSDANGNIGGLIPEAEDYLDQPQILVPPLMKIPPG